MCINVTFSAKGDPIAWLESGTFQEALAKDVVRGEMSRAAALEAFMAVASADEETPASKTTEIRSSEAKRAIRRCRHVSM